MWEGTRLFLPGGGLLRSAWAATAPAARGTNGRGMRHPPRAPRSRARTPFPTFAPPTLFCYMMLTPAPPCLSCHQHACLQLGLLSQRAQDDHGQRRAAHPQMRRSQQPPPPAEAHLHADQGWRHLAPQAAAARECARARSPSPSRHSRRRRRRRRRRHRRRRRRERRGRCASCASALALAKARLRASGP